MASVTSTRSIAKAARRQDLITAAAKLFAREGYSLVSLEDIGHEVGISGPAIYRHFSGKQDLLAAVLMSASENLVAGATQITSRRVDAQSTLKELIAAHVEFALASPDVIKVQDREVQHLADEARARMRQLQRQYIGVWITTLSQFIAAPQSQLRLRVQATFGLLNSTPHATDAAARSLPESAATLRLLAWAALTARP